MTLEIIEKRSWDLITCRKDVRSALKLMDAVVMYEAYGTYVFCYLRNITIDGVDEPCPDHPFVLLRDIEFKIGKTSYKNMIALNDAPTKYIDMAMSKPEIDGDFYS